MAAAETDLLRVEGLTVAFPGPVAVVGGVSFSLGRGEMVGLVGESGCGKTMTALALMRLLPAAARRAGGAAHLRCRGDDASRDLLALPEDEMRALRGSAVAMIFQEPMTALNPVMSVGEQIGEMLEIHTDMGATERRRRVIEAMGD
ncbi:MAG TPA: ATP-binding cassette domain-containing protein, partial [Thermoanaerobaculia bacterium]|nr:ATP-binding cassette domain-containing protein [Thermoanaerobaculia bacterium]